MSDRLALATAIEDAGIERAKAVRIASVIWDAIHENVATKSDLEAVRADLKADIAGGRAEMALVEHRLLTRLGGLTVVLAGLLFAALHLWPAP
jgi:hypothetical protein